MNSRSVDPSLEPGTILGPYEITAFLAAGGMGEVYRARDRRLDRDVAVKILPVIHETDPDRLRRFEQESRAASRLSHPNIITVYDVGSEESTPYIVTELLEGRTLRSLIQQAKPSIAESLRIISSVLSGLAAAHEKGIAHRDLKPANIFLTHDDHVKILDFGLAKLTRPESVEAAGDEDTLSLGTRPGGVVGTVSYMSPEQVQGEPTDSRTDIFSIGVILYELISGQRPFDRDSRVETMAAVLRDAPDEMPLLSAGAQPALISILKRCLSKNPDERFQSARDLSFALSALSVDSSSSVSGPIVQPDTMPRPRRLRPMVLVLLALSLIAATLAIGSFGSAGGSDRADEMTLPSGPIISASGYRATYDGEVEDAAISPDGQFVGYVSFRNRVMSLRLEHLGSRSEIELVPGREGRYIDIGGFSADGSHLEVKYFSDTPGEEEYVSVPLLGGAPTPATLDELMSFQLLSRDGRYSARTGRQRIETADGIVWRSSVELTDRSSGATTTLATNDDAMFMKLVWAPDGKSIISSMGHPTDFAPVRIDIETGSIETLNICPGVGRIISLMGLPDGSGLIATTDPRKNGQLWSLSWDGSDCRQLTRDQLTHLLVGITADSGKAATIGFQKMYNLWRVPLGGGAPQRLTSGINTGDGEFGLSVTSAGEIVYSANASGYPAGNRDLWITDLSGNRRPLTRSAENEGAVLATPDGQTVIFEREVERAGVPGRDLWTIGVDGSDAREIATGERLSLIAVSADGQRVIYMDGERLLSMPLTGGEATEVMPGRDCRFPQLSRDGELLWCLDVSTSPATELLISAASRRLVREFEFPRGGTPTGRRWAPDDRSLLYIVSAPDATGNIWRRHLSDGTLEQVTAFESDLILSFDIDPGRDSLIISRGAGVRDVFISELERKTDG